MYKYLYLWGILLSVCFNAQAQSTFFHIEPTDFPDEQSRILEMATGDLLILNQSITDASTGGTATLSKYSSQGELITRKTFTGSHGAYFQTLVQHARFKDRFIIAGHTDSLGNDGVRYRTYSIKILDENLNEIHSLCKAPEAEAQHFYRRAISYSDSITFLLGQFISSSDWRIGVWRVNHKNNTWHSYVSENRGFSMDMILKNDSTLSIFYSGPERGDTQSYANSHITDLDLSLQFLQNSPQPREIYLYPFAQKLSDSTYLLSGMASTIYKPPFNTCRALYVCKMSNHHDSIYGVKYHPDYPDDSILYPFMRNNIAISDSKIAIGGIYNIIPFAYPFQSTPVWIQFTLFDHALNMEKQLYYGDGIKAYYGLDIIPTSDGGYAISGVVNDPQNTTSPQPDLFLLKVNHEGLITGTPEIDPQQVTEVVVWPNPGGEVIHLKTAIQLKEARFTLYNSAGKQCHTEPLSPGATHTITTQSLPHGIYTYRITDGNRLVKSGKWVRK